MNFRKCNQAQRLCSARGRIGTAPVLRTEATKKLWDYIKAQGLQDPADKRSIKADAKLQAVFGKPSATMFELAGILGKHLSSGA